MESVKAHVVDAVHAVRNWINLCVDYKWNNHPFGKLPHATAQEYTEIFNYAKAKRYEKIDALEESLGFKVERDWLEKLVLHTQIVKKKSDIVFEHGRLLYSLLRAYIAHASPGQISILETGTARGYSALCMAKALFDAGIEGRIVSVDVLPHLIPQIWNCIDDLERPKSRAELLAPWSELTSRVLFLQSDTKYLLPRIGLERINFAFLDAQHTFRAVSAEFEAIRCRQVAGDMIFFDDVTPAIFPGVEKFVKFLEDGSEYSIVRLVVSEQRAYAWATRL